MTDVEFNPEAKDGDNDGIIQEGTPFERPIEEAEVNPVVEAPVAEPVLVEDEPAVIVAPVAPEETPAIVPVENGVIGTGKVVKKKDAPKPKAAAADKTDKVAIFSSRNSVWQGVGKIVKGYNFVTKDAADKWLTLDSVRAVEPNEIKSNLG